MLFLGTVMKSATRIAKVKSPKRRSAANTVNGTVPPRRVGTPNSEGYPHIYNTKRARAAI